MNFLRNFLQGKETIPKTGDQSSKKEYSSNLLDVNSDIYPLSRSATDPSNCASSERSSERSNFKNTSEFKQVNVRNISEINSWNFEGPENLPLSVSHKEKSFKERASFKIENHLFRKQNCDQDISGKASFLKEDSRPGPEGGCNFATQTFSEPNSHDINFSDKKSSTSKEPSATHTGLPCDLSCQENSENNLSLQSENDSVSQSNAISNEIPLKVDKQIAEDTNYLEYTFEDSKKIRKPPARLLGKKAQNNQKKGSKSKQQSSKKKVQNVSNFAIDNTLANDPDKEVPEEESASANLSITPEGNQEKVELKSDSNVRERNIETTIDINTKEFILPTTEVSDAIVKSEEAKEPILISDTKIPNLSAENIQEENKRTDDVADSLCSVDNADEVTRNQEESQEQTRLSNCESDDINSTILNLHTSDKSTFESCCTVEGGSSSAPLEKEATGSKRSSIISISCYGKEEFEILGNEANKLAEELTYIEKPTEADFESMTSRSSADEFSNNFGSLSLENEGKSERMISKRDSLLLQVGDSEAGPDIATGLTSNDLKCASEFFREAAELESQIRRNIASSVGSYADFAVETDRNSCASENDIYSNNAKIGLTSPPHEERSAPEGTSSPDPKSLEDSEVRSRHPRSPNCPFSPGVNELLKKQALEFEEKLLRQGIVAAEKEKELHEMLKEEQKDMQKVTASRDALLKLVEQYKGMLGALVSDKGKVNKEQEEKTKALEIDKQQALEDLSNVEAAFSDVHRKYERTKQIVDTLRRNEETLRTAVADYEQKLLKQERKYVELQKHAEEKVKLANDEYEALRRTNDQEMTKMGALLKKAEMKIISLQENLERKNRENQELTQLCDDLISKVGS